MVKLFPYELFLYNVFLYKFNKSIYIYYVANILDAFIGLSLRPFGFLWGDWSFSPSRTGKNMFSEHL